MFGIFWTASCNYCFSSELLYFTNLALHSHTTVRLMMDSFKNKTKQKSIKVDATEPKKVLIFFRHSSMSKPGSSIAHNAT